MRAIGSRKRLMCVYILPHMLLLRDSSVSVFREPIDDKHRSLPQEFHTGTNYHHTASRTRPQGLMYASW